MYLEKQLKQEEIMMQNVRLYDKSYLRRQNNIKELEIVKDTLES
jgi:hypothetical protein